MSSLKDIMDAAAAKAKAGEHDSAIKAATNNLRTTKRLWASETEAIALQGQLDILFLLKEAQDKIQNLELIIEKLKKDQVTGLPNRQSFIETMSRRIEETQKSHELKNTAIVFIDLDGFKEVNDNCGHATGDQALRDVAQRLQGAFRRQGDSVMVGRDGKTQTSIGRIGGDEMVLMLAYDDDRNFDEIKTQQKIRDTLNGLVYWGKNNMPYPIDASIGCTVFNKDILALESSTDPESLVSVNLIKADQEMYRDKWGEFDPKSNNPGAPKNIRLAIKRQQAMEEREPAGPAPHLS